MIEAAPRTELSPLRSRKTNHQRFSTLPGPRADRRGSCSRIAISTSTH
jgi:hypothetical protein